MKKCGTPTITMHNQVWTHLIVMKCIFGLVMSLLGSVPYGIGLITA